MPADAPHSRSTDELLARRAPIHAAVSSRGEVVVTTAEIPPGSDEVCVSMTVLDAVSGAIRSIAGARAGDHSAAWDHDGRALAWCTRARDGTARLRWAPAIDAPAEDVPGSEGVAGAPAWSPDGRHLAWVALRRQPVDRSLPYRWRSALLDFDGVGALDAPPQVRVLDRRSGTAAWLTDDRWRWGTLRWSPDGTQLAACAGLDPDGERGGEHLEVLGLDGSRRRPAIPSGRAVVPAWLGDGRLVVLVIDAHDRPMGSEPLLAVIDGEQLTELDGTGLGGDVYGDQPAELCDTYDRALLVGPGDTLIARTVERGRIGITRWTLDDPVLSRSQHDPTPRSHSDRAENARRVVLAGGERSASPVGIFDDQLVLVTLAPDATAELAVVSLAGGDERVLTDFAGGARPAVTVRRFAVDTDAPAPIDAWLLAPAGAAGPLPAVLIVHGGPNYAYGESFSIDAQALCAAGFAVLWANPRGSTGAGAAHAHAVFGDWAGGPSRDLLAVIDAAVAAGWIDGTRLGVCGNSYGGFMTAWLSATTTRFRAAVAENPVTDIAAMESTSDIGGWFLRKQFGPADDRTLAIQRAQSPLHRAAESRTPTLWVVADHDRRCPPSQAWAMHRVLCRAGVESEVLVLPGASHEGSTYGSPAVRRAHDAALVDWMSRWVIDT